MINIEGFEGEIIDKVKSKFMLKEVDMDFSNEFYYPKLIHILKFNIKQYEVKGLGNMTILEGRGLGIMKMITVIFTPSIKNDIPLLIVDFIQMINKRTVLVEFYTNHIFDKSNKDDLEIHLKKLAHKYRKIDNYIEKPNWYTPLRNKYSPLKKGTKDDDIKLYKMVLEYLDIYLDSANKSQNTINKKNKQLEEFIDDLIYKGNPSAFILEKALGKEETIRMFKDIVFYYDGR